MRLSARHETLMHLDTAADWSRGSRVSSHEFASILLSNSQTFPLSCATAKYEIKAIVVNSRFQ